MRVGVVGLWHLGSVTAACLAKAGYPVIAYDPDQTTIANCQQGQAPVYEPQLKELLTAGKQAGKLHFTSQPADLAQAEVVWITFDTPVDDRDIADVEFVKSAILRVLPHLHDQTLLLISSQVPVGTTRELADYCALHYPQKNLTFAYSPENLRLGKAIHVFTKPERIVVGLQTEADKKRVQRLLQPFTQHIIWMSIESAEMTKHALNAFLAVSVVFINELATLCERVGADAREVERGLKSEQRIGAKAYLRPGAAIAGGTLARDVNFLVQTGIQQEVATPLFSALLASNEAHKQWVCQRLLNILKSLKDKTITTLGLTYKADTDTLRRSTAVEICAWLKQQGAKVIAYDPAIKELPAALSEIIELKPTIEEALHQADAVLVTTEWPEFTALSAEALLAQVKQAIVFDASGFLMQAIGCDERIQYYSVGRQA